MHFEKHLPMKSPILSILQLSVIWSLASVAQSSEKLPEIELTRVRIGEMNMDFETLPFTNQTEEVRVLTLEPGTNGSLSLDWKPVGVPGLSDTLSSAYFLEGFDTVWTTTSGMSATYPVLKPGKYVFRVKAARNGLWNEESTDLAIQVVPFWYQTWWFKTLLILFIISLVTRNSRRRMKSRR